MMAAGSRFANPRAVPCPTCGAQAGRYCLIRRPRGISDHMIWSPPAHPARVAYARHAAGVAR